MRCQAAVLTGRPGASLGAPGGGEGSRLLLPTVADWHTGFKREAGREREGT